MLSCFDKVMIRELPKVNEDPLMELKAKSINYNHCDDVWSFNVTKCIVEG